MDVIGGLIVIGIIIYIVRSRRNRQYTPSSTFANTSAPAENQVRRFKRTKSVGVLQLDDNSNLFRLKGISRKTFAYEDLVKYELHEDGQQITSGGLSIGGAIIGGAIHRDGALLGGLTGKRKNKDIVTDMYIGVTVSGQYQGYYKIVNFKFKLAT